MGNNRGSMDDRMCNSDRGDSRGEGGGTIVGDLGDIAVDRVRVVVHMLDPAVGKGNGVRALSVAGTVAALASVEVGVGVVVSDGVVVGVGGNLIGVHLSNGVGNRVGNSVDRGVVSRGSMDNRGGVDSVGNRGGMNKRSGVGNRVSNNTVGKSVSDDTVGNTVTYNTVRNSVANNTVGKTMSNHTSVTSSMEGVGVHSNGSNVSSEGLGLRVVSNLSLEGLGDGHMRGLSSSNSDMCNRVCNCSMSNMANKAVSTNQAVSGEDLGSGGGGSHQ